MRQSLLLALAILVAPALAYAFSVAVKDKSAAADGRVFEMRTYIANDGKNDAMHKRFRDHTVTLFKKHGMESVGYWVPEEDKDGAGSTLIYILAHKSRDEAKKSWAAFGSDPEWQKVRDASEKDGKLVKTVISVYLDPTDYSAVK